MSILVNYFTCQQPIKVDYRIYEDDLDKSLITVVTKSVQPHPDFQKACLAVYDMVRRFCEFDKLTENLIGDLNIYEADGEQSLKVVESNAEWNKLIVPQKISFPTSDKKGTGIKINFIFKVPDFGGEIKMVTPTYWDADLTFEEKTQIEVMKQEAFAYAHQNKQAQTELEFKVVHDTDQGVD